MRTPRPYISFSQMTRFEMDRQKFVDEYIYGKKQRISRNMSYGSLMAESLENEEDSGDPVLDLMIARLPKFDRMDLPVEDERGIIVGYRKSKMASIPVLTDGKEKIPVLALPDTAQSDYRALKEYKTSTQPWTQKRADESGQITFYAMAVWLAKGFIPDDIELVNVPVEYLPDGSLQPTGEMHRFKTKRTMIDIIKMTARTKKAWAGIKELCENELI